MNAVSLFMPATMIAAFLLIITACNCHLPILIYDSPAIVQITLCVLSAYVGAWLQVVTSRRQAKDWMQQHWRELLQQMQDAGWQTQQAPLAQSDHTAEWGNQLSTHID